ncbi:MFS transporter [Streptomyces polygonati]|uniref:MFS transporter n=1 Tax=Streptomyces polygonati TaxID=1617087 RepID=A0ABV8HNB5_9ACTN
MLSRYGSHRGRERPASPWRHVVATWLAGVQAAVGLGAVAPVGSAVQSSLGLSFSTVACATSGMTAVGAVFGVPVGWWTSRFGARRALPAGLVVISAAAGLSALASSWPLLLGLRTAEGAGYLLVFVAGPIVLTGLTRGRTRAAALALWGTCVPTGLALAAVAGGALADMLSWNDWLGVTGLGPLLLAAFLAVTLPRPPPAPTPPGRRPPGAATWVRFLGPAGAYACLSLVGVALVVLLPTYLMKERHETSARAGAVVALVSAGSALGGLLAGALLRRGVPSKALVPLAALMPPACLPAFSRSVPLTAAVGAAFLALLVDGLLISAVFAAVPAIARRPEEVDLAGGALAQLGSLGILTGPPLFGLVVGQAGWGGGTVVATLIFTALGAGLLLVTARSATTGPPETVPPSPPRQPQFIGHGHGHGQGHLDSSRHRHGHGHGPDAAAPADALHRRPE